MADDVSRLYSPGMRMVSMKKITRNLTTGKDFMGPLKGKKNMKPMLKKQRWLNMDEEK